MAAFASLVEALRHVAIGGAGASGPPLVPVATISEDNRAMARPRIRPAVRADLPRIHEVRHGTAENRLTDPALVTEAEVLWYMDEAIFLVCEDEAGVQGFTCVNHQTGYVWALFVIDAAQGRGHGTALLDAAMARLRSAGHRQAFLSTGDGTKAEAFYRSRGWRPMGVNMSGEAMFRLTL
jgi:GNAT superfamily N-acetyltransferase